MGVLSKHIFAFIIIPLYLISMAGVGVYKCHCGHSNQIVLLTTDDCDCRHDHVHLLDCNDQEPSGYIEVEYEDRSSKGHCCQIIYEVLDVDQETISQKVSFNNNFKFITLFSAILPVSLTSVEYHFMEEHCQPLLLQTGKLLLIYQHSQLRL